MPRGTWSGEPLRSQELEASGVRVRRALGALPRARFWSLKLTPVLCRRGSGPNLSLLKPGSQADTLCVSWRGRGPHTLRTAERISREEQFARRFGLLQVSTTSPFTSASPKEERKGHHGALFAVVTNRDSALCELRGAKFSPVRRKGCYFLNRSLERGVNRGPAMGRSSG